MKFFIFLLIPPTHSPYTNLHRKTVLGARRLIESDHRRLTQLPLPRRPSSGPIFASLRLDARRPLHFQLVLRAEGEKARSCLSPPFSNGGGFG